VLQYVHAKKVWCGVVCCCLGSVLGVELGVPGMLPSNVPVIYLCAWCNLDTRLQVGSSTKAVHVACFTAAHAPLPPTCRLPQTLKPKA